MKVSSLFLFVFLTVSAFSQNTINNFKYVLVPERFSFSKADDQYGLNTLTKLLLQEKGFTAFVGNEALPPELAANKCNALIAEVGEKNGLLTTKVTLQLKDCQGNVIFKSKEGKSREKDYATAYDFALRDAFTSLTDVPYKYVGGAVTQALPQPQPQQTPVTPAASPSTPAPAPVPAASTVADITGVLYAQVTPNGFQLIDTTPKKVLTLLKTSMKDYFIAIDGAANGVVFKKDEEWFFEYYKDSKLVSHKLQIKF